MLNKTDMNTLNDIEASLDNRVCNYKEFLVWMRIPQIFSKFILEKQDGISIYEVQLAFKQMNLPIIEALLIKSKQSFE